MPSQNYFQPTLIVRIREFFWPMLDPEEEEANVQFISDPFEIEEENLDQAFELITKCAEGEEARSKGVEAKATLFLSTISIATTLIVASSAILLNSYEKSWTVVVAVFLSFIVTLYSCATVWFSIKALERGNYGVVGFKDLNSSGNKVTYKKHLILKIKNNTDFNHKTINAKVDNLTMAQLFYKRAIVSICLYAFLIVLFCIFIPSKKILSEKKTFLIDTLKRTN